MNYTNRQDNQSVIMCFLKLCVFYVVSRLGLSVGDSECTQLVVRASIAEKGTFPAVT